MSIKLPHMITDRLSPCEPMIAGNKLHFGAPYRPPYCLQPLYSSNKLLFQALNYLLLTSTSILLTDPNNLENDILALLQFDLLSCEKNAHSIAHCSQQSSVARKDS